MIDADMLLHLNKSVARKGLSTLIVDKSKKESESKHTRYKCGNSKLKRVQDEQPCVALESSRNPPLRNDYHDYSGTVKSNTVSKQVYLASVHVIVSGALRRLRPESPGKSNGPSCLLGVTGVAMSSIAYVSLASFVTECASNSVISTIVSSCRVTVIPSSRWRSGALPPGPV